MVFLAVFAFGSFVVFNAGAFLVYPQKFGFRPTEFSSALAVKAISISAGLLLASPLTRRIGTLRMIFVATTGFALSTFAGCAFGFAGLATLPVAMGALFVSSIFPGIILPSAQVQALAYHGSKAGLASSLGGTMQMVAAGMLVAAT